ncbi:MAG: aminotransferase class I/II-fold pyridoxal phosphate-dependent enzyme [Arcanobacterium sp.]|nr:aminotransferase class I/II-fold pyridoxal phosphate-dependent enzyme [Arcanobacterium sp.]
MTINWAEKFDHTTLEELRSSGGLKWSTFPDAIGMFVAEMDFGLAPAVADVLRAAAQSPVGVGYPTTEMCELASGEAVRWYSSATGENLEQLVADGAARVHNMPSVLSALGLVLRHLIPAGAPVVVPTPAYMPMLTIPPKLQHPVIQVPSIVTEDGRYHFDYEAIERAVQEQGAKLFILVNPWNPTGRVLSRAELERLDSILSRHPDVRVFSDEIHTPFVFSGKHVPYWAISHSAACQTVTAFAPNKGWNIPGLHASTMVLTRPSDERIMEPELASISAFTAPIGMRAAAAAYRDSRAWSGAVVDYLRTNRDLLQQRIDAIPGLEMAAMDGTYIAWIDCRPAREHGVIPAGVMPADWILERAGVALTAGAGCGKGYEDFVRLIFATPRSVLSQALDQIAAVFTQS